MKHLMYKTIIEHVQRENLFNVDSIQAKFPMVTVPTLSSIISQEYQRKMKNTHFKHKVPETMQFYYKSYLEMSKSGTGQGSTIIELAKKHDLSPALMARIIVEKHYAATGEILNRQQLSRLIKNSCLINNIRLSCDVHLSVINDDNYGPFAEVVKHSFGVEYEVRLKNHLQELKVPFLDEDQLRIQGYDKTPDIKLEIPIAINGKIINWIESKASFGDPENHKHYLKEQFWSYWNRFGSGLVIYWFGFVDELDEHSNKGIVLRDSFPNQTEIQMMDPDIVTDPVLFKP